MTRGEVYPLRVFRTLGEVERFVSTVKRPSGASSGSEDSGARFSGTESLQEALHLLSAGWPDGAVKLTDALKALPDDRQPVRKTVQGLYGNSVNVGRLLNGSPYPMDRKVNVPRAIPVVRLRINLACSGGNSVEDFRRKAIMILRAVCALEHSGTAVEISTGYSASGSHGERCGWYVTCKQASERFDASRLAFALSHPSMLRRIGFAVMERVEGIDWSDAFSGYGYPTGSEECRKAWGDDHGSVRWISWSDVNSDEDARRMVTGSK
jgi:hypothetical protein